MFEKCICGKKCKRTGTKKRIDVICHCDACGVKWGEHCREFDVNMKENCVSCGEPIKCQCEELYNERGNYCNDCSVLSERMTKIRRMTDYFVKKLCENPKCFNGYVSVGTQSKKCRECLFQDYSAEEKKQMFNELFIKSGQEDLVDSSASEALPTFFKTPKKEKINKPEQE